MSLGRVLQPLGTIGKTAKLYRSVKPSADNVIQLGDKNKNFSKSTRTLLERPMTSR